MLEDRTVPTSISGLSPAFGPTAGGTTVSISGSDFTGATAVYFGTALVANVDVVNDGLIYAYSPAGAAGVVDVTVTSPDGTSPTTSADQFTYTAPPPPPAPVVTGLSPNTGSTAGGTYVQIGGSGFTGATGVSFGGVGSAMFYTMSDNVIYAYDPAEAAGMVDVHVTTAGGTSATSSADQFTYTTPPPASTWTYLSSSANPTTFGKTLTLTATVSNGGSGTPTGTVEFDDGGNVLGTATLTQGMMGGQATLTISSLTVGPHSLTALYYGDSADAGSTSSVLNQTVQQATTTTTLTSNVSSSEAGQAVTFTAEVDGQFGGAPTGTVTFKDASGATLGTADLSPGGNGSQATLTVSTLPAGTDPITAVYGGDANFGASTSSTLNQVVQNNGAFVWTGDLSSDWDKAGNWLENGVTATTDPNEAADVIFSGVGEVNHDCATDTQDGPVTVHSLTMDPAYMGTLTINAGLDVTSSLDVEGGNINQPNGVGTSDIYVTGAFNWTGGVINSGNVLGMLYLINATSTTGGGGGGGAPGVTGDTIDQNGGKLSFVRNGNLTFTNDAGITLRNGAIANWDSGSENFVTTGSGVIKNLGGTLTKTNASGNFTLTSDLPYINNNLNAVLDINVGKLVFTKAGPGPSAVSVLQIDGTISLSDNTTLEVDAGLTMNDGTLAAGLSTRIAVGDVKIHGGVVNLSLVDPIGSLTCDGFVTMDGGTYAAGVYLQAKTFDSWTSAKGFSIGNNAALHILTFPLVPGPLPPGPFHIMTAPVGKITGDFGAKSGLHIWFTGQSYTAMPDKTRPCLVNPTPRVGR